MKVRLPRVKLNYYTFLPDPERGQSTIFGSPYITYNMVTASRRGRHRLTMPFGVGHTFFYICHLLVLPRY